MSKGFARIKAKLDEEALDYGASAKDTFCGMVEKGTAAGWLVGEVEV